MSEICIVVGTRPETIKMAPVIRELKRKKTSFCFIHTGQHFDYTMSKQFIEELELPKPDHSFELKNHKPAAQIGEMMGKLEKSLSKIKVDTLLVQGDTNTMLAAALTGVKLGIKIGHVEAGLRSYDWRMPEEHNRRMVDHVSDLLFAPTKIAKKNLEEEHVYGDIHVTGNTVIDAVSQHMSIAKKKSRIMNEIRFGLDEYALLTAHRVENVESPDVLKDFCQVFLESPVPLIFPIHPRTLKKLKKIRMYRPLAVSANVELLPPVGYLDFLLLLKNCKFILTDSGGLQEEATSSLIRKPVLILRSSTERPEAVKTGFAKIVGTCKNTIINEIKALLDKPLKLPKQSPFGDGKAGKRIIDIILKT